MFQQGRYSEAQDEFRKARTADPKDARLLYYLGLAAARVGELSQADARFKEALAIDPAYEPVQMSLGALAYNAGRYADALAVFKSLAAAHPDDPQTLFYLSLTFLALREPEKAQEVSDRLRRLVPEAQAHATDGILLYHRGQYREALATLSEAERANPDLALLYYYEGLSHYALGQFDRVSPRMLRAKTIDPGLAPGALYYSGLAYYREEQLVEAREDLQTVIVTSPESALGRSARAFLAELTRLEKFGRPWDLTIGVVPQYDTNVIALPDGRPLPSDISRQQDAAVAAQLAGAYRPYQTDRWTVTGRYTLLQLLYQTLAKNNVQNHEVGLTANYRSPRLQGGLQYGYTYTIQEKTPFVTVHTIAPTVTFVVTRRLSAVLQTQMKLQDYIESKNDDRDGTNSLAGLTAQVAVFQGRGSLRAGYTYDQDATKSEVWQYQGGKGSLGFAFPLFSGISADLSGEYYQKQYQAPAPGQTATRKDNTTTGSAGLNRSIGKAMTAALRYVNIRNASNVTDYDYARQLVTLTLQYKF